MLNEKKLLITEIIDNLEMQSSEVKYYFDRLNYAFVFTLEGYDDEDNEKLLFAVEDSQRFIPLPTKYDINEYQIMQNFTDCQKEKVQDILLRCLNGKGVFRRFKDRLFEMNMLDDWFVFKKEELKKIAIDWCEENSLEYI